MAEASLDPIRVLHVDDEPDFSDLAAKFIEREDERISVETAATVSEGLDRLSQADFDCIVSDLDMPGQNGIEFLEAVRQDSPELPFILFTGKGSEEVASEAISAGVTDYLQKQSGTSQYEVLVNRIRNAVESTRATQAIRETEEWVSTLLKHSSDFVFVTDENGDVTYISPSVERILGYQPDEVTGTSAFEFTSTDDRELAADTFAELQDRPSEDVTVEFRATHTNGSTCWLEVTGRNLLANPVIEGILVNARDITERKERERELAERESDLRLYERAVEGSTDLLAATDLEGNLLFANEQYRAYHGLTVGEVPSVRLPELLGDAWESTVKPKVERAFAGEVVEYEMERPGPAGDLIRLHIKYYPMRDEAGSIVGSVASMRDVTGGTDFVSEGGNG